MSDWEYFSITALGNEEKPIDAGQMVDIERKDTQALIDQKAVGPGWPIVNTPLTTTSATYNSSFCRLPAWPVPSADSLLVVAHFTIRMWAQVSSAAQDGTIRVWACPEFRTPADVAEEDMLVVEAAIVESPTPVERVVVLEMHRIYTFASTAGQAADEPANAYRETFIGIQGKVTGGATFTLNYASIDAGDP